MKIVFISDTHGKHDFVKIPTCDILIHCGDWTNVGNTLECEQFFHWFIQQPAKELICIAGNHELGWQEEPWTREQILHTLPSNVHYLENQSVNSCGLNIFGSPYSLEFFEWAYQLPRDERTAVFWSQIPHDTDIVVTHGPPLGFFDNSIYEQDGHFGDQWLLDRIMEVKPKVHAFGHFHYGREGDKDGKDKINDTLIINATICNENYSPIFRPVEIEL